VGYKFIFVSDENNQLIEVIREGDRTGGPTGSPGANPYYKIDRPGGQAGGTLDLRFTQQGAGEVFNYFIANESIKLSKVMTEQQKAEALALLHTSQPGDYFIFARLDPTFRKAEDVPVQPKPMLIKFVDP